MPQKNSGANQEKSGNRSGTSTFKDLLHPSLKLVLTIGVVVAILQQITGINSVFFYAPMIFEQSGIGTDASFVQAILVGLVNLVFTVLAMLIIDKFGRKPLLIIGVSGIVVAMSLLSYGFGTATYTLTPKSIIDLPQEIDRVQLAPVIDKTYTSDVAFKEAMQGALGKDKSQYLQVRTNSGLHYDELLVNTHLNMGFVASFAISLGPVMWVLFSELFPNTIRGVAISFVGLINSAVSFLVQWVFPWELDVLGSSTTFMIYGVFALLGLIFILRVIPETKGKTLEELEAQLVG